MLVCGCAYLGDKKERPISGRVKEIAEFMLFCVMENVVSTVLAVPSHLHCNCQPSQVCTLPFPFPSDHPAFWLYGISPSSPLHFHQTTLLGEERRKEVGSWGQRGREGSVGSEREQGGGRDRWGTEEGPHVHLCEQVMYF